MTWMLVAWVPIALLERSLVALLAGVLLIDFALQSGHVSNQTILQREGLVRAAG